MATKKITELPLITRISGSQEYGGSVLPVVVGGTTNQISPENFSRFVNAYDAQTGSQNIFTQNQWFNTTVSASNINVGTLGVGGNTTIAGTLGVGGNGTIGGNLAVAGRITAEEFYTEITTASVIYASGSTKFGDDTGDKHEFTGSINVSGSVIYNGVILTNVDANTIQKLQQTTQSLQVATASLQAFTASQDVRNFTLSQITASFAGEIGGLEEYTASLKTAAIVSSSTQILNYNIFATTGSNTFRGNQIITGSLSISAGEFNVITGSGNMTSSLIFDHTQNDGVTLGLRHNDRLSAADHTFNVNVWAAGVYTTFVQNGTPYSILNVEAFDDNKIYLYRDTRLFNKSLVIDNNLTVQKGIVIGSGSLSIPRGQFSAITGSGALTSSLSFTHTEVDPITGDATLALRYRNNQVGSENNAWKFVATDNGVQVRYDQYTTSNKMLFSLSSFGSNFDKLLIWRDTRLFGTGLTVDDSLLVKGVITGSLLATNGVVSSSNQLFELNQFTASQDGRNLTLSTVTGSLIGITNGLMAFTAALDNTYATDAQLYQLYQATRSLELHSGSMIGVTNGLMAYTASNTSLNTGLRGEVDGIQAYTASLKGQAIVSSSTQVRNYDVFALNSNLFTATGSLIGITNGLMAFTAALDNTYATDAQLFQLYQATRSIELTTGSLIGITNGLMALTASMKGQAIVSSSTQIQNYDVFALNSNLYNGTGSIKAEVAGIEAYTASLKGAIEVSGQNVNVLGMITAQQFNVTYVSSSVMYQSGSNKFGNSFDDKHEVTGSLNVSGGLSVNGTSAITITSNTAGNNTLNLISTNNANSGRIQFGGATFGATIGKNSLDADSGLVFNSYHGGAEGYTFQSNGTNVMKLTSAGRLGIDVSNPDTNTKLHIADTANGYVGIRLSGSGDYTGTDWTLYASSDGAPSANDFLGIQNNSTTDGGVINYKLKVYKDGNVNIPNGNLVIGTSGKGIDFSTTSDGSGTMTSELLDDYEEGSWTPTLPNGGTITINNARYVKVGQKVTVSFYASSITPTNNGSDFLIGGLPYANTFSSPALYFGGSFGFVGTGNLNKYLALTGSNLSYIYFHANNGTGAGARLLNSDYFTDRGDGQLIITLTYFTAT
jgi:hypothetical protein